MSPAGDTLMRPAGSLLSVNELAERCGLHPDVLHGFVVLGLIDPEEAKGEVEYFRPEVSVRVQRIVRLRRDLGVNYAGIGVVLDLLERVEFLEARLEALLRVTHD